MGDRPFLVQLTLGVAVYATILMATGVLRIQKPFRLRVMV
jgi:hypothetical protein